MTALLTLCIVLALGEGAATLILREQPWPAPPPPPIREVDPYVAQPFNVHRRPFIYFMIPRSRFVMVRAGFAVEYEVNARGFRGPELGSKGDDRRLVVVGDSIVEGHGVEFGETFTAKLDRSFQSRGWRVIDAGVSGASPVYYAANLPRYLSMQPDAVVLTLFTNDLYEDRHREGGYFGYAPLVNEEALVTGGPAEAHLPMNSRVLALVADWRRPESGLEKLIRRNRDARRSNPEQEALNENSIYLVAPSLFPEVWSASRSYLDFFSDELAARGIPLFIVDLSRSFLSSEEDPPYRDHALRLAAALRSWAEERHLPYLEPLSSRPACPVQGTGCALLIEGDGHPTAATHGLLAAELAAWLETPLAGIGPISTARAGP